MTKRANVATEYQTGLTMAQKADPHELYELSVQSVEDEVEFLEATYLAIRRRKPRVLREDFCGTAHAACEWVRTGATREAIAVDIEASVLEWGKARHYAKLPAGAKKRIDFIHDNVLNVRSSGVDILVAFNFSYWTFKTRDALRDYFRAARESLGDDGLFFVDLFGGSEAFEETKEKTKHDDFTYIWDQAKYDPVTGDYVCHIHFRFPDGSKLKKAFTYHWRLWTVPEVRELLAEAGFSRSTVYWEGVDEDGEGNGEYEPVESGEADPAWIAYVVAEK